LLFLKQFNQTVRIHCAGNEIFIKGKQLVNRLGKRFIVGDAAALILLKSVKILPKCTRGRAQRQKCSTTLALTQVLALLISLRSLRSANSLL